MGKIWFFAAMLLCAAGLFAEEEKKSGVSFLFGGTLNDGNSVDRSGQGGIEIEGKLKGAGFRLSAEGHITKTTIEETALDAGGNPFTRRREHTTANNAKGTGKLVFPVRGALSSYMDFSVFTDEMADLDYRMVLGPGIAYELVKTDSIGVVLESGISPMWEKDDGGSRYHTAVRLSESLVYKPKDGAKIWQSLEYLPAADDGGKYLVNAEIGAESPLNDTLSLRIVAQDRFNSRPGEGKEKNDVIISAGIRIKL